MRLRAQNVLIGGILGTLVSLSMPRLANACGGFFCNSAQQVNQAAERIIFANNGDGSVTAVIQIQYEGPSESFSWLLPIPTVPKELKVASEQAFTILQNLTNPSYTLQTSFDGDCLAVPSAASGAGFSDAGVFPDDESVHELAAGNVGPYDWTVIQVDNSAKDKSVAARDWLTKNKYDVPPGAGSLLNPYLDDNMALLAIRLSKGQTTGSIRPILLTYQASAAMIPVKLTAVAANENMGVMTWLLGDGRGVPSNYNSLELNEARINWFSPNSNYNDVVNQAANEAGGQGFVTEFAGSSKAFKQQIWSDYQQSEWQDFQAQTAASGKELFEKAYYLRQFDGFWDAVQKSVTLSQSISFDAFRASPRSYIDNGVTVSPEKLIANLRELVIEPMQAVQSLIDAHPKLTRLYTTLSAEEMTVDPLFTFNAGLPDISNVHVAKRVYHCAKGQTQFSAPWSVELPQGGKVLGEGGGTQWPEEFNTMPANRTISKLSASGLGVVLENNSAKIAAALGEQNDLLAPTSTSGTPTTVPSVATPAKSDEPAVTAPTASAAESPTKPKSEDSGCNIAFPVRRPVMPVAWLSLGLAILLRRRTRLTHN